MTQKVLLSSAGFQNAAKGVKEKNFTFIVGGNKYQCNSFFADFISPKVAQLHLSDPLADTFVIKCKDKNKEFELVMDIMHGKKVFLQPEDQKYLAKIGRKLGNTELYNQYMPKIDPDAKPENIDFDEIFDSIRTKCEYGLDFQDEADIIAKYTYFIDKKDFVGVPLAAMERIINSPNILLDSENQLVDIVCELIERSGPEYTKLITNMVFQNIEIESINKLLEKIKTLDVDGALWAAICKRLVLNVPKTHDYSRYKKIINVFLHQEKKPFSGIFNYLKLNYPGNPAESVFSVSAKREHCSTSCVKLFSAEKISWGLTEVEDNFLLFDFKRAMVRVTGYEIRSGTNSHWDNPQSWVIETSNDNSNWNIIDRKQSNTEMGGNEKVHYWKISEKATPARYVRWRLTQNGTGGLYCREWELYGEYIIPSSEIDQQDYDE